MLSFRIYSITSLSEKYDLFIKFFKMPEKIKECQRRVAM